MKLFHRPLFALLLSLLLLGSQQAAFAHLLTHLHGGSATGVTHYQSDHGAIDKLADTCTTCIAFAGAGGSTPTSSLVVSVAAITSDNYLLPAAQPVFARSVVTSRARAPPAFL